MVVCVCVCVCQVFFVFGWTCLWTFVCVRVCLRLKYWFHGVCGVSDFVLVGELAGALVYPSRVASPHNDFMVSMQELEYEGIFVVDSFFKLGRDWNWQQHVGSILLHLYESIGWRCLAVVIPGAAFLRGSYLRAIHVLCNMVASPRFMVWISMGNDVYPPSFYMNRSKLDSIVLEIWRVMRVALRYCSHQRLVYGGSSWTWQYQQQYGRHCCNVYDNQVREIIDLVHESGDVRCITGANLFHGLQLIDRIGHVSPMSLPIVTQGIFVLAKWAAEYDANDYVLCWRRMMRAVLVLHSAKQRSRL